MMEVVVERSVASMAKATLCVFTLMNQLKLWSCPLGKFMDRKFNTLMGLMKVICLVLNRPKVIQLQLKNMNE